MVAALAALLLLAAAPPAKDWSRTVSRTAAGAYVLGNPKAPVRLIEYLSYTCPHCAEFAEESAAPLKGRMVRSGRVSIELRHAIREKLDLAAAVIARCAGPGGFFDTTDALFAAQRDWYLRGLQFQSVNEQRMAFYSDAQELRALADGSGLIALAEGRGQSAAALDACFADAADLARIAAMTDQAWAKIRGTPSFEINGVPGDVAAWAPLEPKLRAAGAK